MARNRITSEKVREARKVLEKRKEQKFRDRLKMGRVQCNRCFCLIRQASLKAHKEPCRKAREAVKKYIESVSAHATKEYHNLRKQLGVGTKKDELFALDEMLYASEDEKKEDEFQVSKETAVHSTHILKELSQELGASSDGDMILDPKEQLSWPDCEMLDKIRDEDDEGESSGESEED